MFVAHDVNASKKAPVPPVPDVDAKRANAQTRVVLALVAAALLAALAPAHAQTRKQGGGEAWRVTPARCQELVGASARARRPVRRRRR